MNHHAGDTCPSPFGTDNTDRIRELLREIHYARGREIGDVRDRADLGRLWQELEQLVVQEMGWMVDEELAMQD
jgi:hypothetical protein